MSDYYLLLKIQLKMVLRKLKTRSLLMEFPNLLSLRFVNFEKKIEKFTFE